MSDAFLKKIVPNQPTHGTATIISRRAPFHARNATILRKEARKAVVIKHGIKYATDARPFATQGLMPVPFGLTPLVCGVIANDVANAFSTTAAPLFRGVGTLDIVR